MNCVQDKMTWRQALILVLVIPPLVVAILVMLLTVFDFDAFTKTAENRDRCMKHASTGADIQQCRD